MPRENALKNVAYVGFDLGDGESIIDFAVLSVDDLKNGGGVLFSAVTMPDNNRPGQAIPTVFGRSKTNGETVFASAIRDDPENVQDVSMNFKRTPSDVIGQLSEARCNELVKLLSNGWPSSSDAPELNNDEILKFRNCIQSFTTLLFTDAKIKNIIASASSRCRDVVFSVGHPTKWNSLDVAIYNAVFRDTPIGGNQYAGMNASLTLETESRAAFLYLKNKKDIMHIQHGESVLIIDTGSSTIDLTAVTSDSRKIRYNSGNNYLGARGIDFLIMDWYLEKVQAEPEGRKLYEKTSANNPSINQAILLACREAKEYIYSHSSGKKKIDCVDFPSKMLTADDIRHLAETKALAPVLAKYFKLLDANPRATGAKNWLASLSGFFSKDNLNSNLKDMDSKTWMALLREFLAREKEAMSKDGINTPLMIITGSASKMPFVMDIVSQRFTEWHRGSIKTLNNMMAKVESDLKQDSILNAKLTSNQAYNSAVNDWLHNKVGQDIAIALKEICNRHGMSDIQLEDLNFLNIHSDGIKVDGIKLEPGKDILDAMSTILVIIGGIVAAIALPYVLLVVLSLISLISMDIALVLLGLIMAIPGAGQVILVALVGLAACELPPLIESGAS